MLTLPPAVPFHCKIQLRWQQPLRNVAWNHEAEQDCIALQVWREQLLKCVWHLCGIWDRGILAHSPKALPHVFGHSFTKIEAGADLHWGTCPQIFRQPAYEMQKFRSWSWWNFTSQSKIYWNLYQDLVCIPKQMQQGAALKLMGEIDSCDEFQFLLSIVCLQLYLM